MNKSSQFGSALLLAFLTVRATGGETSLTLADGPQASLVRLRCSTCHSLDYVIMNSRFLVRSTWEAEVRKMMKVMGAPIPENDVTPIVDYLMQYYGAR